jgi:hypothetical protein
VFLTADSILLLLVLGPTASRTFINALYFFMRQFIHNSAFFVHFLHFDFFTVWPD